MTYALSGYDLELRRARQARLLRLNGRTKPKTELKLEPELKREPPPRIFVRDFLDVATPEVDVVVTMSRVKKIVAQAYKLTVPDLESKSKSSYISWPRQIAMYLCKKLTGHSTVRIGRSFRKDHSTVGHGTRRIAEARASNLDLDKILRHLEAQIMGLI